MFANSDEHLHENKAAVYVGAKAIFYGRHAKAISALKREGKCANDLKHRQFKHLNNIIESDHGKLKRLIKPTLGFKSMKTAYATIKGFEVMKMFKKEKFDLWTYGQGIQGEIRIITNNLLAS